ncbi:Zn-dependent hydrolase [Geomicrobium sp. JSM 1781026]|uniref:Zn-dependent hydrolase n=1 Tax=Geomicrobium sp. JSM 1781026 TaxID=3344580 RepID=UPI0035BF206A
MKSFREILLSDYNKKYDRDGISGMRMAERLHTLSKIGETDDGGSHRPGFSDEEWEAKKQVAEWMKAIGMEVRFDGAGNVIGKVVGKNPGLPAVISGAHLDSVPNGGHFDGPLGVLSALEVAESWVEAGVTPLRTFEIIVFTEEEGSRFQSGLLGSQAMIGGADLDVQKQLKDGAGQSFEDVLHERGSSIEQFVQAKREFKDGTTYIELHIEQGKVLEREDLPVGIVSGIAGPRYWRISFQGTAGHAGNTPMTDRQDALVAASQFVRAVYDLPTRVSDTAVATVGKLDVSPNGSNVIPGEVTLVVDVRDIHREPRDQLFQAVKEVAQQAGDELDVCVTFTETLNIEPVPVAEEIKQNISSAIELEGYRAIEIASGAGHDAMVMGTQMPVGMIFVRSLKGVSHHPEEWTSLEDCVIGARVLKRYVDSVMSEEKTL